MPINIIVGLLALLVALILYTVGVWAAFLAKTLKRWHVIVLWAGVLFDMLATGMMALQIGGFAADLHTLLAMIAWAGMVAVAGFGTWALVRKDDVLSLTVAKWSLLPWALWVAVLVYGMVERGAQRMAG
jgi:uncharacterized repeat protein (TIGR03987 family)